jgi:hypothetical protein
VLLELGDGLPHVQSATPASLASIVANILDEIRKAPSAFEFSFGDISLQRLLEQTPFPRVPSDLPRAAGVSIQVFCKESTAPGDDLFTALWRDERGGLSCVGRNGRFRAPYIPDRIRDFYTAADYRSFGSPHPSETSSFNRVARYDHARMLLVRHGVEWAARELCPQAYPGPTPAELKAKQAKIFAEMDALKKEKSPEEKQRRRRALWDLERKLLDPKVSDEEKTRIKQEVKAFVGLTAPVKITPTPPPPPDQRKLIPLAGGGWAWEDQLGDQT